MELDHNRIAEETIERKPNVDLHDVYRMLLTSVAGNNFLRIRDPNVYQGISTLFERIDKATPEELSQSTLYDFLAGIEALERLPELEDIKDYCRTFLTLLKNRKEDASIDIDEENVAEIIKEIDAALEYEDITGKQAACLRIGILNAILGKAVHNVLTDMFAMSADHQAESGEDPVVGDIRKSVGPITNRVRELLVSNS